jgi:hypothetical protein
MNSSKPKRLSEWFAGELLFAWLTLTGGAVFFAMFATLLTAMGSSEAVSFFVPMLITLAVIVALHFQRLAKRASKAQQGRRLRDGRSGVSDQFAETPSGKEMAELFVEHYWSSPPERRTFRAILEDVARELDTQNDQKRMKAELESARQTIQQLLETLS